ncbi:MAG: DUF4157 domain-containing protein [Gammaproteobacteria bacterium]|nr:DUF4157 domain-containing protein [Gammaproteobacteria bacterium]
MNTEVQTKVQASPAQNFTPAQTGLLQRQSALCNTPGLVEDSGRDEEKLTLQRSSADQAGTTTVPPIMHEVLRSPGQPLDAATRVYMEPRFGHDISKVSVHSTGQGMIQAKLKINKPGDLYEQEADRVAEQVLWSKPEKHENLQAKEVGGETSQSSPVLESQINNIRGDGQPLPESVSAFFEPRFGYDFSRIRVHSGAAAEQSARNVNAKAYAVGHNIVFGAGQFAPGTHEGRLLIAHELTHVVQQSGAEGISAGQIDEKRGLSAISSSKAPYLARSVDDWLMGSVNVSTMSYTEIVGEIDELSQWMERQIESSEETVRIEETLVMLRREAARREAATHRRRRRSRRKSGRAPKSKTEKPMRRPRILIEMSSVAYEDPQEMRAEFDLIMEWLSRDDIPAPDRQILVTERDNLKPQFREDLSRVMKERHAARLSTALTPSEQDDSKVLEQNARIIQGIVPAPENIRLFYLYHGNERVAISSEQVNRLKSDLEYQLKRAQGSIRSRVTGYYDRYNTQAAINRDSPIISGISGWLGDVEDPWGEINKLHFRATRLLRNLEAHLRAGNLVEAAAIVAPVERDSQKIMALSKAFTEGHIEGAEMAKTGLEITRDAAFAISGSIAAVVAAPVVAGFVGAGGLGATGVGAAALTTGGTGLVVGTGTAVVRGTSVAGGHVFAGSSWDEVSEAFRTESVRGFREGFMSGAAGGAARVLGPALGVGAQVGNQTLRRIAAEAIVNGTTAMVETIWRGGSIEEAVTAGLQSAVLSAPGALVGGANSRLVRELGGPLTAGATAYLGAIASGASPEDAMQSAALAVTTNIAMSRASHGSDVDTGLEARGSALGKRAKGTVEYARRRARDVTAAVVIGTADTALTLRLGYGGTTGALELKLPSVRRYVGSREGDIDTPEVVAATSSSSRRPTTPAASAHAARAELQSDTTILSQAEMSPMLELDIDNRPLHTHPIAHNEIDLSPIPLDAPSLSLYGGKKWASEVPGMRARRREFGAPPSAEVTGTHRRTGQQFNELNAAEISAGVKLMTNMQSGQIQRVQYVISPEAASMTKQTDRSFTRDRSTDAPQSRDSAYLNSGYDRGHLVQREAVRGDADVERAVDQWSMVVPMSPALNRGAGSPWRASETHAMQMAAQNGPVTVVVEPIYAPNPLRLEDGTPIPRAIRRKLIAYDGQVIEDISYLNQ